MTPFHSLKPGTRIADRYTVTAHIGGGRSLAVYEATDDRSQSTVALKIMDPFLAQDPTNIERFLREAQIIRHLNHPQVIKVFDLIDRDDLKCIVMEYFPSVNLSQHLKGGPLVSLDQFVSLATAIVETVRACHERLIVHRDLKPQNILLNGNGEIKLVDFGISRMSAMPDLTKTGTALGTPEYMPPEAFQSSQVDSRADIYSMGAVLYEVLTGLPPYPGQSLHQIMSRQMAGDFERVRVLRPEIPEWVDRVLEKCLRADPADRYQNCGELLEDLKQLGNALANFDSERDPGTCLHCSKPMRAGLPFCISCGKFRMEMFGSGSNCVVITSTQNAKEVSAYLSKAFPGTDAALMSRRLGRLPALVVKGVSRTSADIVVNELYRYPVSASVMESMPEELRLPWIFYVLALVGLLPIGLMPQLGTVGAVGVLIATELGLWSFFNWRMRPIIKFKNLKGRDQAYPQIVLDYARELPKVADPRLRVVLSSICTSYLTWKQVNPATLDLDRTMAGCLKFAAEMNSTFAYLRSQNISSIKKRLDDTVFKINRSQDPAETARLIEAKAALLAEYSHYRETQDRYADSLTYLLNISEKMTQSLRRQKSFTLSDADFSDIRLKESA